MKNFFYTYSKSKTSGGSFEYFIRVYRYGQEREVGIRVAQDLFTIKWTEWDDEIPRAPKIILDNPYMDGFREAHKVLGRLFRRMDLTFDVSIPAVTRALKRMRMHRRWYDHDTLCFHRRSK